MNEGARVPRSSVAVPGSVGALLDELASALSATGRFTDRDATNEAREIVAALYEVPRFWPSMNAHASVDPELRGRALLAVNRRGRGAPLAYAVGRAAFRHLTLDVDERVLIPRPETEQLVELVLERAGKPLELAVDVGTGSGAIALALATEGSFGEVLGIDVSLDALTVAEANARMLRERGSLRARVSFAHGSLLAPLRARGQQANVIVSNPPYIAFDEASDLPADVRDWEPPVALFSAAQGLEVTRQLIADVPDLLVRGGLLALEVDARRASLVAESVAYDDRYDDVGVHLDLAGRERFVLATRR